MFAKSPILFKNEPISWCWYHKFIMKNLELYTSNTKRFHMNFPTDNGSLNLSVSVVLYGKTAIILIYSITRVSRSSNRAVHVWSKIDEPRKCSEGFFGIRIYPSSALLTYLYLFKLTLWEISAFLIIPSTRVIFKRKQKSFS